MASILAGHTPTLLREHFDVPTKSPFDNRILCFLHHESHSFVRVPVSSRRNRLCFRPVCAANSENLDEGDGNLEDGLDRIGPVNSDKLREDLEKIVGCDDSSFSGVDLATLIRKKYGRSYDVQLIKKEFMGRNLLAMNVMWKYREQRSFPLSEEEYILRLDDVANMLKCWGAVSHVRNSLEKVKQRPRIGKAVSIFIDMDEIGGRANEWIYK